MGTKHTGQRPADSEASWMDDTLPLELRRKLLDSALERIKAKKQASRTHPGNQDQSDDPGESGPEPSGHSS